MKPKINLEKYFVKKKKNQLILKSDSPSDNIQPRHIVNINGEEQMVTYLDSDVYFMNKLDFNKQNSIVNVDCTFSSSYNYISKV